MTIEQLIDYLRQFPAETRVFLTTQAASDSDVSGDFVILESLVFDEE